MRRTIGLISGPSDVGQTRLDRGFVGGRPGQDGQAPTGPILTVNVPFTLIALADSQQIAPMNLGRLGLMMQNKDITNNLFYEFGQPATAESKYLSPGQYILLDFVTPQDAVFVYATVALSGHYSEFARQN